jgi:hypothetical protein
LVAAAAAATVADSFFHFIHFFCHSKTIMASFPSLSNNADYRTSDVVVGEVPNPLFQELLFVGNNAYACTS